MDSAGNLEWQFAQYDKEIDILKQKLLANDIIFKRLDNVIGVEGNEFNQKWQIREITKILKEV